jgi:N-acetylmuramoyl-L-alanine amidase
MRRPRNIGPAPIEVVRYLWRAVRRCWFRAGPGTRSLVVAAFAALALAGPATAARRSGQVTDATSRGELAHAAYERASALSEALEEKPASDRTLREYERVVAAYRRVYFITPQAVEATPALVAIGKLDEEMGRQFGAKYFQAAVDSYQFLVHQYPKSRYVPEALLAVARLEQEELGQTKLARRTYEEFLRRFPDSPQAGEARDALAAMQSAHSAADSAPPPPDETTVETNGEPVHVTAVHYQTSPFGTLVTLLLGGRVNYRSARIRNPDRIYFDLYPARLVPATREKTIAIHDGVLKDIRVAQNNTGVVRVVLEPERINDYSAFLLRDPDRLVINLRSAGPAPAESARAGPPAAPPAGSRPTKVWPASPPPPTRNGDRSLTRTLGLKIERIVIDPGHGGYDTGTIGPNGLMEKNLCLDVALRLGRLIQEKLPGTQVVYTRKDDRFIPLETRTALANQDKADLFISIHANSSHNEEARGIETYYLNFTTSSDALEVATRENAQSNRSIHDLQDLLKKIARNDKIEESRELAADVQDALVAKLRPTRLGDENRGVRKAPFVVLIGANMPSILAEISFLSNPTDARLLRTPLVRQRIAQGLFNGIVKYLASLNSLPRTAAPERQARLATQDSAK